MAQTLDNYRLDGSGITGQNPSQYTKILLHMDGANAGQVFADEMGHAVTYAGNAQTSTTSPKFGASSALFDGNGDYIEVADSEDFALGTSNFSVDFWVKYTTYSSSARMCSFCHYSDTSSTLMLCELLNGRIGFAAYSGGAALVAYNTSELSWTSGQWYHIAIVRDGSTIKIYRDGTECTIDTGFYYTAFNNGSFPNFISNFKLGVWGTDQRYLTGNIDEFRLTVGRALWTANFTAPAAPSVAYPDYGLL